MFLVGILSWWYQDGLVGRIRLTIDRFKNSIDFFSINILLSTLFSPFRQISANESSGFGNSWLNVLFDKLLSRFIGAFMRLFMIIVGIFVMFFQLVFGIIILIIWLIIPSLPVIGLIITTAGIII